jgi:hypothetical protein
MDLDKAILEGHCLRGQACCRGRLIARVTANGVKLACAWRDNFPGTGFLIMAVDLAG